MERVASETRSELERVMGIEPTTFSLGTDSGHMLTDSDSEGKERATEGETTTSGEKDGSTYDCHPDS
jgi:hypothetical protein